MVLFAAAREKEECFNQFIWKCIIVNISYQLMFNYMFKLSRDSKLSSYNYISKSTNVDMKGVTANALKVKIFTEILE